jgi:hypothetical protein
MSSRRHRPRATTKAPGQRFRPLRESRYAVNRAERRKFGRHTFGPKMGLTRSASTDRLSTEEVIRHQRRDPDALRRARFGPAPEQVETFDLLGTPAVGKTDRLARAHRRLDRP